MDAASRAQSAPLKRTTASAAVPAGVERETIVSTVAPGIALIALHAATGAPIWQSRAMVKEDTADSEKAAVPDNVKQVMRSKLTLTRTFYAKKLTNNGEPRRGVRRACRQVCVLFPP